MNREVKIAKLSMDDAPKLAQLANNPSIAGFLRNIFPSPYELKDAEWFIPMTLSKDPTENFGIYLNEHFCGICGAHPFDDIHNRTAEIGYWLGQPYWGQGIATIAIQQLIKYCFETVKYSRIQAITFDNNIGSMRVLEKNALIKEGIMRKHIYKNGVYYDAHLYGITDDEYRTLTTLSNI